MTNLVRNIRGEFQRIKQALEEHLQGINENTSEIQSMFDYLQELDLKIEKINQRMDNVQLGLGMPLPKPIISPLDHTEKKMFLTLYTEESALSFEEIANKSKLPLSVIPDCVSSLVSKGIPLTRNFCNNQLFIKIDPSFKEIQAKEGIINLSLESFM